MQIWHQGQRRDEEEGRVRVNSPEFRYGQGFFSTTAVKQYIPLWLKEHILRLQTSMDAFGFSPFDPEEVYAKALLVPRLHAIEQGYLRILTWREEDRAQVYIETDRITDPPAGAWKLKKSGSRRHSSQILLRYKSFNYWHNELGCQEAQKSGYDDALFFNEQGEVCETSRGNLFLITAGGLATPDISCGLLPGIAREKIINLARESGMPLVLGRFRATDLACARGLFITNSVRGIIPVGAVDDRSYHGRHPLITQLSRQYRELVQNCIVETRSGNRRVF